MAAINKGKVIKMALKEKAKIAVKYNMSIRRENYKNNGK